MSENTLVTFAEYLSALKKMTQRQYDRNINKDLSQQKWQEIFKRNVTGSLKQAYQESLLQIQKLDLTNEILKPQLLALFEGFIEEFMQYTLHKHRTSCALSNFPDEHNPSQDYITEVLLQINADWQGFCQQVEKLPTLEKVQI